MGSRHHSKDALEYHRQNSIFLTKLHRMMMEELSHKNQYIEKLEAEVRRLSITLDQQQLENEKMMSQRIATENIKAAEVVKILEESADSDTDDFEDLEVSTCSESTSIDIVEATKSNTDDISETDESQEFSEFDDTNYEPCQKKSKSELTVDEATNHLLSTPVNIKSLKINLTIPVMSVNTTKTRISRSRVSHSKITQEQRSTDKTYSYPVNPSKKASSSLATAQCQKSTSINEEPQEENVDPGANVNRDDVVQSGDISEDERNQEADGSEDVFLGNPIYYRTSKKIEKRPVVDQSNRVNTNLNADVRKKVKDSRIIQKAFSNGICKVKQIMSEK